MHGYVCVAAKCGWYQTIPLTTNSSRYTKKAYCDIHRVNCCAIELKISNLDRYYWNDEKIIAKQWIKGIIFLSEKLIQKNGRYGVYERL
jgi:hypothetical protein